MVPGDDLTCHSQSTEMLSGAQLKYPFEKLEKYSRPQLGYSGPDRLAATVTSDLVTALTM